MAVLDLPVDRLLVAGLAVRQLIEEVDRIHKANCALKIKHISGQLLCRRQNLLEVGGVAPAGALDEQIFQILLCHFGEPLHKREL